MLGLKLNHISKRGHWGAKLTAFGICGAVGYQDFVIRILTLSPPIKVSLVMVMKMMIMIRTFIVKESIILIVIVFYIWHCVPNILLWSILCKTVGLPSSTGESERTARRQLHSPTLRCFRGHLCEVAAGRGPLKQSRWAESNWTLPLRSVGVAPSLGRFWLVFAALKLRYVLRRHIILSDSDGNQAVLDCFTVSPGLGGSAK